jgi:prepilin-type N-terminal cleavage/methylation domain-containing protein
LPQAPSDNSRPAPGSPARPLTGIRGGFTLVEILVSVLIITIGLVSAIFLQILSVKNGTRADNMTVASLLAESEIERLKTYTSFNQIPSGVATGIEPLTRDGQVCDPDVSACFFRTTMLVSQQPTSRSHTVRVTVSWTGSMGADSVTYEAILTDINLGNSGA